MGRSVTALQSPELMPRLILLTPGELTRDPRARRAACAGLTDGWEVVGVCPATGGAPAALDGIRVVRLGGDTLHSRLRSVGLGGGRPDTPLLRELRGIYRLLRLTRLTVGLVRAGRRFEHADVVHANDFDTLPAGSLLARAFKARLVYDAHELYTFQEADPPRLYVAAVRLLERMLARRADAVVTVSEPIARELQRLLGLARTPFVVLNCPALSKAIGRSVVGRPLHAVYQGAVGLGRSLDDLLDAAALADGVELTLRVVGADLDSLRSEVAARGLESRVHVREPVEPADLVDALWEFDVGVIATRPLSRNDELAVPNKLFEYLMAGLAIVVPRLSGLAEIVEREDVGLMFEPGSPTSLGQALTELGSSPDRVARLQERARELALGRFNAEAQRPALIEAWSG
jgi:glycosyltransferase involved in cell wall biosynthesis